VKKTIPRPGFAPERQRWNFVAHRLFVATQPRRMTRRILLIVIFLGALAPVISHAQDGGPIETDPVLIEPITPVYPEQAQVVGLEGAAYLSALVGEDGKVKRIEVDSSDHEWFTQAAIEAMNKARFTPALLAGGKPTEFWYAQKISFKLTPLENSDRNDDPDKDEFISVTEEPKVIDDLQSLIEYTEAARRAGIEGKVVVTALIDTDGRVLKVDIELSDNSLLNEAARSAMFKARYNPAICNGVPVKVWFTQVLSFKLE
jgi:TonB family protein